MCSFLGMDNTFFWCLTVQQRKIVMLSLSVIIILGLSLSVNAFYFDFQYFETDKYVYEVGETIDMVARLIADFSPAGWCYVSFAAVTDMGPVFSDEYFISASSSPRMLNSSYTLIPEDTNPGVNGTTAHIIFNVEIYDTVSQGAGDNIEITITRGHLTVEPVTPLVLQFDKNTTLVSRVVSIHDENVEYANEPINVQMENPSAEIILDTNTTTNPDGSFNFDWNSSMGLPGIYDLTVSGIGNEDFLGFSKSLPLSIVPSVSNLTIISAPNSIQCQSPDGSHFENASITVRHEAADYSGIIDSTIFWDTGFNNGLMTHIGNGYYTTTIPFQTAPGLYTINVTTSNPRYQTKNQLIPLEVNENILHFYPIQTNVSAIHGTSTSLEFSIEDEFEWDLILVLEFKDNLGEFTISKEVIPYSLITLPLTAWYNLSIGPHLVIPEPMSEYYSFSGMHEFQFTVIGELVVNTTIDSAYYGLNLQLNLSVHDINSNLVEPVTIMAYYNNEHVPFATIQQISLLQPVSIPLPLRITPGEWTFSFEICALYFTPFVVIENTTVWMKTNITLIIEPATCKLPPSSISQYISISTNHDLVILESNSLGSIMRPPPILFNETTSTVSLTTRETSPDN
jgi:hypothetical protein